MAINMKNKHANNMSNKDRECLERSLDLICPPSERQSVIEIDADLAAVGRDERKLEAKRKIAERRKLRELKRKEQ